MRNTIDEAIVKWKLGEIADIQLGYPTKGRVKPINGSPFRLVQIKDFDEDRNLQVERLTPFEPPRHPSAFLLQPGDVLFLSRGHDNWAVFMGRNMGNLIPVAYFFIIRPNTGEVLPSFLAWYLNSPPAKVFMESLARRGSHMPVVPKSALVDLPVDVPPMPVQQAIAELDRLGRCERQIEKRLAERRALLVSRITLQAARNHSK